MQFVIQLHLDLYTGRLHPYSILISKKNRTMHFFLYYKYFKYSGSPKYTFVSETEQLQTLTNKHTLCLTSPKILSPDFCQIYQSFTRNVPSFTSNNQLKWLRISDWNRNCKHNQTIQEGMTWHHNTNYKDFPTADSVQTRE